MVQQLLDHLNLDLLSKIQLQLAAKISIYVHPKKIELYFNYVQIRHPIHKRGVIVFGKTGNKSMIK